ncbi:MAG TPA: hypothetical protein VEL76_02290, partial [Gemmataceae bacterium]|nr:hypothetical protein [Gemmataceae bacterium]
LTVGDVTGTVGQAIPLLIQASTADTDVPETLSIEISGLPAGATLSAGTDEGNGVWRLTVDQLNGLTLTIPDSFSGTLTVTATTTLVATGATATTKRTFVVNATTPPSAVLSPPPSPAPAVEVPVFVPKAVPAPVPVSLAPLLEPLLLGPTVTAVLSRASSQSAPPVLPPPLPSGISPDPKTVLAPVAAGQVREVITVGGEPTPVISNTQAILLVVSVQNEFGSLLDARSNVTVPSANSVAILQMRSPILPVRPRTDEGVATGAETEALLPITRVVAATLDGDDSVQLVEALLRGSETPVVAQAQRIAAGNPAPAVPVALPGPAPVASNPICVASADEPGLLGQTLKWLAFPVGVAVLAAGWFWNRRRRKAAEKSLTGSLRCETPPPNPLP